MAPTLAIQAIPEGETLCIILDGAEAAHLYITPFRIRLGQAVLQVDGIGDVWTEEAHRKRGYARQLMEGAVQRMRAGTSALSLLYGIDDFYPKFGYAFAGAEQVVVLDELARSAPPPACWQVRPATPADLPAIQALYDRTVADVACATLREPAGPSWSGRAWRKLAEAMARQDAVRCRVVVAPDGHIAAMCWYDTEVWFVSANQGWYPETMAFAEVLAESLPAAEVVLSVCRTWALEEGTRRERPVRTVTLPSPHQSAIGRAAAFQDAELTRRHHRVGGFMARTLDPQRLLTQLLPELRQRLRATDVRFDTLRFVTDEGDVTLRLGAGEAVIGTPADQATATVVLPQAQLAQLALGAFPPEDLLAQLDTPPDHATAMLLKTLFPRRDVHIFAPDRP
jgi:predicted acetyltransferase